jgi:hypothetical protein
MIDNFIVFLIEFVCFYVGKVVLITISLGRINPKLNESRQPFLVSLLGAIVLIVSAVTIINLLSGEH